MSYLFEVEARKPKGSLRQGSIVLNEPTMDRVTQLYRAGMSRLPNAGEWYDDTFYNIQNIMAVYDNTDEDTDQLAHFFVDVLAATSPRCSIIRNTFLATQIFAMINDSVLCRAKNKFEAHLNNICRSILGLPLSGQKVLSFQANLLGDKNAVTVDTWMMRVFNMPSDVPSEKEYEEIAAATRKIAKKFGVTPAHMQAALWVGIKAMEGDPEDTPEPFEVTLERFKVREGSQGQIDFTHAEKEAEKIEDKLSKGETRSNPPEPRYSSPTIYGPRLREIAIKEGDLSGEVADIICEQPRGSMMSAILFCRENIDRWMSGRGDAVEEMEEFTQG